MKKENKTDPLKKSFQLKTLGVYTLPVTHPPLWLGY